MSALCFYSKYSSQCKTFTEQTKSLNLQYICIDNSIARNKIKNNKQFQIQYVPCVLILYENGVVEKYEGEHAFRWAKTQKPSELISTPLQQEPPQEPPREEPQQEEPLQEPPQQEQSPQKTDISTLKDEKPAEKLSVKDLAQQLQSERNEPLLPKQ
jgi:hypothetical protein